MHQSLKLSRTAGIFVGMCLFVAATGDVWLRGMTQTGRDVGLAFVWLIASMMVFLWSSVVLVAVSTRWPAAMGIRMEYELERTPEGRVSVALVRRFRFRAARSVVRSHDITQVAVLVHTDGDLWAMDLADGAAFFDAEPELKTGDLGQIAMSGARLLAQVPESALAGKFAADLLTYLREVNCRLGYDPTTSPWTVRPDDATRAVDTDQAGFAS